MEDAYYQEKRERAKAIYDAHRTIQSPFFEDDIVLNSDGFHHLRYSARRERSKDEQVLKFTPLALGLKIFKSATTLQEYRRLLSPVGDVCRRDGAAKIRCVEWRGVVDHYGEQDR